MTKVSFWTHQEYEEQRRPLLTSLIAGNSPPPKALQVAAGRKQPQHPLPGLFFPPPYTHPYFFRLFQIHTLSHTRFYAITKVHVLTESCKMQKPRPSGAWSTIY